MDKWLLLLIAYLPFQIAFNPGANFDLASLRVFIVLFFLVWLVIKGFKINQFKNLQNIGLILFLILAGFSLIGAENFSWGLRKILFFASIFPLYWLVFSLINDWSRIRKIVRVLIWGGSSLALIGLLQFLAQFVFGLERVYGFWANNILPVFSGFNLGAMILAYPSWSVNVNGQTLMRAFSLFSDPHIFSFYLGLILPLIIICLGKFKGPASFFYLFYFLVLVSLLFSFTRGAYLAIMVAFLVLIILFWKYLKNKKIPCLLFLCLLIFIIPGTFISDRLYSSFDLEEGSNQGRLAMWQQAGQVGWNNFWQGVGLGNYSLTVDAQFDYRNPATAHNFYLDVFSEMGIFALIVWLGLILGTLGQLLRKLRQAAQLEEKYLLVGLIGALVYLIVHSCFETLIYSPSALALLMVILSISSRLCFDVSKNN
ncbi:MAG: O-antigen ligase family protein [Patescibacteria group bacterium]